MRHAARKRKIVMVKKAGLESVFFLHFAHSLVIRYDENICSEGDDFEIRK